MIVIYWKQANTVAHFFTILQNVLEIFSLNYLKVTLLYANIW